MADPKTPETPENPPEKTSRAGKRAQPETPADAGINASITGSVYDPAEKPKLHPDDPGINANVVS